MSKKGRFARRGVRNKTGIGAEELDQVKTLNKVKGSAKVKDIKQG